MAKKKVFVSFDYENDKDYKYLLNAWDANPDFEFSFNDQSPDEIQSDSIPVVKANLTKKINGSTYTLVLCGSEANKIHKDYKEIGYRNWQNFEVAKSVENRNRIVCVDLCGSYQVPEEAYGVGAVWVKEFSQEAIINGLNEASKK